MSISILKRGVTASDIGRSERRSMTRLCGTTWASGQCRGTFLKLTGADALAYAEYQSMLRQLSSRSSSASGDLARLKKYPKPGDASVIGARRPCRVI